ncbi:MAG: methyl-accepting chemotaxis protein [Pseudomonadota bacterium]
MSSGARQRELNARLGELCGTVGLDTSMMSRLKDLAPVIDAALPAGLDAASDALSRGPNLPDHPDSAEAPTAARDRQFEHWSRVVHDGRTDAFLASVDEIGDQWEVGVDPVDKAVGYALILEHLINAVIADRVPEAQAGGIFKKSGPTLDKDRLSTDVAAILRAAFVDMGLGIAVHLREIDQREKALEAERDAARRAQDEARAEIERVMRLVADGDLSHRVRDDLPDGFQALGSDINDALASLSQTIPRVNDRAATIENAIKNIAARTGDLSERTGQQAASVEQSSAVLTELSETVANTAREADSAMRTVSSSAEDAKSSGTVVERTSEAMARIEASSDEIVKIVTLIDEIAFQTTLLALNASVEAARAGESGRGFAVVAQEVRNLARRCADAAETIKTLVAASATEVQDGVELVSSTRAALTSIIETFSKINQIVSSIAGTAREQSTGIREVSSAVNDMDGLTQKNAVMVDETSAELTRLSGEVTALTATLAVFTTSSEHAVSTVPASLKVAS